MAIAFEKLVPDAIITALNTNSNDVNRINNTIDGTDNVGLGYDGNGNVDVQVSFPTPSGDLVGIQTFSFRAQKSSTGGQTPQAVAGLAENGTDLSTTNSFSFNGDNVTVVNFNWNANLLSLQNGSGVEAFFTQTSGGSGGNPNSRRGFNVDEIEWVVQYETPPGFEAEANVIWV
jgi:hypothetical protein